MASKNLYNLYANLSEKTIVSIKSVRWLVKLLLQSPAKMHIQIQAWSEMYIVLDIKVILLLFSDFSMIYFDDLFFPGLNYHTALESL